MSRPTASFWLGLVLSLPVAGCSVMQTVRDAASESVAALRPDSSGYSDPAEMSGDPWIQRAGVEARGNRPRERSYDPLGLRNLFMSEKALDIERNMGIE